MLLRPALVRPLLASVLASACVVGLVGCRGGPDAVPIEQPSGASGPVDAGASSPVAGGPVETRALRVLHAWDARRAAAYARDDVAGLRGLYVEGSRAGKRDVRLLRSYAERGLVVDGLRMQVLGAEVLRDRAGVVRVRVQERVASGRVLRARGGGPGVALPRDRVEVRVVTLVRGDGSWRVRSVTGRV